MITERQQRLIDFLVTKGYGWAKFARNVQSQGWCSLSQEDTLCDMSNRVKAQTERAKLGRSTTTHYGKPSLHRGCTRHYELDDVFEDFGGERF